MKKSKIFRRWAVYRFALLGIYLAGLLDISTGRRIGTWLGRLIFYALPWESKKAFEGLETAFPEKTKDERREIAKKSFQNLGKCFFEFIYYTQRPQLPLDDLVDVEGLEHLDRARGKGVIIVTAHIGNWEIAGMYLARKGYPLTAIAREVNNEGLNRLMVEFHRKNGMETILRKKDWGTLKRIVQTLTDDRMLAVLIDQDARVPGVFVDFFDKPAKTPSGPVAMALTTGAAVVVGFIVRQEDNRHRLILKPVTMKKVGKRRENIVYNTWAITQMVEETVRRYPEQWVWMHRRWKRQPKKDELSYPSQFKTSLEPVKDKGSI
jgi:KDO2-lipid IV(A) lauroyltransferase